MKDRKTEVVFVRLRLKKIEWRLIRRMAEARGDDPYSGKPSIGRAVADLLRVAFNCLRAHTERYQDPSPLSEAEAIQAGLCMKRKRKGRRV